MPSLETMYTTFIFGMFGMFSCGMFVSQSYMYGPGNPVGLVFEYWTNATPGYDHPYAEWWARMVGVLFISFLSGPILFGAPMESHLKQTMVAMTGILICFCSIIFGSPKDVVTFMWYPQLGLQVVLCLVNAYLIANPTKTKGKKKAAQAEAESAEESEAEED